MMRLLPYVLASLALSAVISGCSDAEQIKNRHLERGQALMEAGEYDKARIEIKNALQVDPRTALAQLLLGRIAEQRQSWKAALAHYQKAHALEPESTGLPMARPTLRGTASLPPG